jgi:hypothetical protein
MLRLDNQEPIADAKGDEACHTFCEQLTNEQKKQFDTEGYLIVKGLFTEDNLSEIDHTFDENPSGAGRMPIKPLASSPLIFPNIFFPRL